jgi:hypothetical protein
MAARSLPTLSRSMRRLVKRVGRAKAFHAWTRGELPLFVCTAVSRRLGLESFGLGHWYGLVSRPNYSYGVRYAVTQARKLGYPGVTVIEMGVAGGNGLVALESHARHFSSASGIEVAVVGFDRAVGLPDPVDHRDLPYLWSRGDFEMDVPALRRRLGDAELVLGDVEHTLPQFLRDHPETKGDRPIGFVAFDLDYWSSTTSALKLFGLEGPDVEHVLPRVMCYFDDVILKIEHVGQMQAIRDFNENWHDRKIGHPFGLRSELPFQPPWADRMFEAHFFAHPRYATPLDADTLQMPLV